jgi:hypothetical protein
MGLIALLLMFPILRTDFKDGTAMTPRVTELIADGKIDSAVAGGFRYVNMSFVDAQRMLVEVNIPSTYLLIYIICNLSIIKMVF